MNDVHTLYTDLKIPTSPFDNVHALHFSYMMTHVSIVEFGYRDGESDIFKQLHVYFYFAWMVACLGTEKLDSYLSSHWRMFENVGCVEGKFPGNFSNEIIISLVAKTLEARQSGSM